MKVNAVEVSAVSRHYRKKQVLREISFDVESGESVVIVGKNGCGKSTLLQIMAGAQKADSGSITYFGNKVGCGKSSRKYYGYVPQENPLFEELSVKDNLKFWGAGKKENLNSVIEQFQLEEMLHMKVEKLSGGMKRRVGLIQALLNEPDFLIVDESTTGLDPEERIRIRNLLVDFSKNRTVLFSTHVVEDLAAACSRLAVMKKGEFLYTGEVSELLQMAKGHIWVGTVKNEEEARMWEQTCHITSKQYTESGLRVKIISGEKPGPGCVQPEITLEDAYMYLMNREAKN